MSRPLARLTAQCLTALAVCWGTAAGLIAPRPPNPTPQGGTVTTVPEKAVANGHRLENDPPHALSSVFRWTCADCGAAALRRGCVEYGSALTGLCTTTEARKAGE